MTTSLSIAFNMKNLTPTIIPIVISVVLVVVIFLGVFLVSRSFNTQKLNPNETILFYGVTCPHCKEVEDFIAKNDITAKINFTQKEVYENSNNARLMAQVAKSCKVSVNNLGVPLLYAEGKCYEGAPEVLGYFTKKAGISESSESIQGSINESSQEVQQN